MTSLPSTIVEFNIANRSFKKLSLHEFEVDLRDPAKIYWIHCDLNDREGFDEIVKKLKLTDDIVNLCNQEDGMPKLIDTDDALTIQIQCLASTEADLEKEVEFNNLILYLTPKFCFTAATTAVPVLLEFVEGYHKAIRFAKTPCFILFLLLDNAINDYAKILFNFELITDQLDERVPFEDKNIYKEVTDVKRQLMKIKRYSIAIREVLMRVSSRNISVISEQCRMSLYNLSSHSHMVVHEIDTIRDILNGLLDQIDNALMQKLSETMKVLTAFAAIFLPLTLITGIYGMNFHWMPELSWKYGYYGALALIVICGLSLFLIFKKMKWF